MKKFLALTIMFVVLISTTACKEPGNKSTSMETCDFGGVVMTIPSGFETEEVGFNIRSYAYSDTDGIVITYTKGIFPKDDFITDFTADVITVEESNTDLTIGGYEAIYYHLSAEDGTHTQNLYILFDDKVVFIYTKAKDPNNILEFTKAVLNVKISDNEFETGEDEFESINIPEETLPTPTPEPTPEPEESQNPYQYEMYDVDGMTIAIPVGFFYNEEVSRNTMEVFHSDWDYTASYIVYINDYYTNPATIAASDFAPNAYDNDYTQDYFAIKNEMGFSHLRYSINGIWYEDYDIIACHENYTIIISMSGPEEYSELFRIAFEYIEENN